MTILDSGLIVVDTSALMAILLEQAEGAACSKRLLTEDFVAISSGTLAELLVVAGRHGIREEAMALVRGLGIEVVPGLADDAERIGDAYQAWGKGLTRQA